MKEGRPSVTASFVAFARGAASCHPMTTPPLHDGAAAKLLPSAVRALLPRGPWGQAVARVATLGLVDHVALRTAAIDAAIDGDFAQLVLLGAGLDGRAYRLASLEAVRVFEVDHPASQASKLAAVDGLRPRSRALEHVAIDFARQDLDEVLAACGHSTTLPTAWVFEGVTMYLPEAATTRVLEVVATRSAPGSLLAMTYMRPPSYALPAVVRRVVDLSLNGIGEPLGALYTHDAMASLLREVGLEPRSDTCSVEWAARFGASAVLARPFRAERLVIADLAALSDLADRLLVVSPGARPR